MRHPDAGGPELKLEDEPTMAFNIKIKMDVKFEI